MDLRDIRDIDAIDVLLLVGGIAAGGGLTAIFAGEIALTSYDMGMAALVCGVSAIWARRILRKPAAPYVEKTLPPAAPHVEETPLVGARSLLSGVLMAVGGLVVLIGLAALALMCVLLASEQARKQNASPSYALLPALVVVAGAATIRAGWRIGPRSTRGSRRAR